MSTQSADSRYPPFTSSPLWCFMATIIIISSTRSSSIRGKSSIRGRCGSNSSHPRLQLFPLIHVPFYRYVPCSSWRMFGMLYGSLGHTVIHTASLSYTYRKLPHQPFLLQMLKPTHSHLHADRTVTCDQGCSFLCK